MLKFLIIVAFLIGAPFLLIDVSSLEVEFQKESERVIESMGWAEPDRVPYHEQIQIVIDRDGFKNKISISMLSKDPNDLKFPKYMEQIMDEPRIISFLLTNEFACVPTQIERACVIIDVEREGLGDNLPDIRKNTREITDKVVGTGVILYAAEFDSVTLHPKVNLDGEEVLVSRALYTINKSSTSALFNAMSSMIISGDIRDGGGFYDHAVELANNTFSAFTISLIPQGDSMLRVMNISLICSDKFADLMRCPENVTEQIIDGEISPLDFIDTENVNRSKVFDGQFLPLNSVIQVKIFSEQDLEVKSVNTHLIEKLQNIGDIQNSGWIISESTTSIDGKYVFGPDTSVNKNDLVFSFGPNTGEPIDMWVESYVDSNGGGCLIATAAFGSELEPKVQFLREIRDNTVLQTQSGTSFMAGFNQFYYSFSPAIADYERENPVFKEAVKITLTPLLASMTLLQYADIDSESEMLGYGIAVILLNIGMYFVAPAIITMKIRKRVNIEKLDKKYA